MNTPNNQDDSQSTESVHPICKNSKTPEKCAQFAEKLDDVKSNLKLTDSVVSRIPDRDRS